LRVVVEVVHTIMAAVGGQAVFYLQLQIYQAELHTRSQLVRAALEALLRALRVRPVQIL